LFADLRLIGFESRFSGRNVAGIALVGLRAVDDAVIRVLAVDLAGAWPGRVVPWKIAGQAACHQQDYRAGCCRTRQMPPSSRYTPHDALIRLQF
jgi:hypothetical protein